MSENSNNTEPKTASNEKSPPERQANPSDSTHPMHMRGLDLAEGEQVLFNDRDRALTVVGAHARQNSSRTWRTRGEGKYYRVVELEGNGTEYHLLCLDGASHGPMLYKEADWDDDKTDKLGLSPVYSRMGERIESMEVLGRGQ